MSTHSSLIMVSILVILTIQSTNGAKNQTAKICDKQRVDECAISLSLLTDPELLKDPPKTLADMEKYCRKFKQSTTCVREYSEKCLADQSRRTLSIIMYSMTKTMRRYCSRTKGKQEWLNLVDCVGDDLPIYSKHLIDLSADMHAIRTAKPKNMRIPLCCCAYQRRKEFIMEQLESKCSSYIQWVEAFLQGFTGDLFNYACGEYNEDNDKCKNIIGKIKPWKKPLEWKSFIVPTVEIIDSL